jgi:cytochrome c biogenesis factor
MKSVIFSLLMFFVFVANAGSVNLEMTVVKSAMESANESEPEKFGMMLAMLGLVVFAVSRRILNKA